MSLYADYHPETSVKGFGYVNKQKAEATLKKLKNMKANRAYTLQVVNTMYNRAKFHSHRTKEMEQAMKVYAEFLKKYKSKTNKKKKNKKKVLTKKNKKKKSR